MASYVVDASVVIEYLINGRRTADVIRFFNRVTDTDRIVIPEFCLLECTNVLWKQVRFQEMARSDAESLLRVLRMLKLRRAPMKRLLDHSLEIAIRNSLAVYDAGYIALALHYGYPLVTIDNLQSKATKVEGALLPPISES